MTTTILYVQSKTEPGLFLYYREFRDEQDAGIESARLASLGVRSLLSDVYAPTFRLPTLKKSRRK